MNEIMLSVRPKWCEKICSGEKTIEVRKTRPKLQTPFKCYIYCTQASVKYRTICGCHVLNSDELYRHPEQGIKHGDSIELMLCEHYTKDNFLNGKVIGEFTCDRIYELETQSPGGSYYVKGEDRSTTNDVARQSCLFLKDMHEYLQSKGGYGWHISYLKIYDKPKQLREFVTIDKTAVRQCKHRFQTYRAFVDTGHIKNGFVCDKECDWCFGLKRACKIKPLVRPPQSWCYCVRAEQVLKERERNGG